MTPGLLTKLIRFASLLLGVCKRQAVLWGFLAFVEPELILKCSKADHPERKGKKTSIKQTKDKT